ncbi:hypothetical protein HGG82_08770 [Marinomonas sp. M1K-6]|uniref:Damage-inducible protein J n=1 Tax=Marinomonas profundi TaxID=2726122 RepID=A0A847QY54_9GAMM|nr:hypothetical protein [Marinomonas profundi]NLQ17719.1 hypothetical protein [Marinomonas profundi]UDV04277.1 hypothetical protein J8N69_05870 [Marinomonas profundi]
MTSKETFESDKKDKQISHDTWLIQRVNAAFDKMENGLAIFVSNEEANAQMEDFKAKIRARNKPLS